MTFKDADIERTHDVGKEKPVNKYPHEVGVVNISVDMWIYLRSIVFDGHRALV